MILWSAPWLFAAEPTESGQTDLVANLIMWTENGHIFLSERYAKVIDAGWPQMAPGTDICLDVPGEALVDGWQLVATLHENIDLAALEGALEDPWQAWLDVDLLTLPLVLRTRRLGERFKPLGMGGHSMKLSDFWVNEGLNRRARAGWPLVFSGEELASVPGFRPAHPFRLTAQTRRAVHLQWFQPVEQKAAN